MAHDYKVGEDWTDSEENFSTTGTLDSGSQTVTGDIDASGTITGATLMQGVNQVLDADDLVSGSGNIVELSDIANTGPSAPSPTFAGQIWFDTANDLIKIRNEANTAWMDIWDTANNKPVITNLTDEVAGTMLADAVAGAGIIKDGSENLAVNPDGTTLEISTDTLQIVSDNSEVTNVRVSSNDTTPGILNGKLVAGDGITFTEGNDGANETLTIAAGYRGALIYLTSTEAVADATPQTIVWETSGHDTDTFDDIGGSNPERLTITAADISYVQFFLQLYYAPTNATTNNEIELYLRKNGSQTPGGIFYSRTDLDFGTGDTFSIHCSSSPLPVAQNDYFDIYVNWTDTTGSASLNFYGTESFFAVKVLG